MESMYYSADITRYKQQWSRKQLWIGGAKVYEPPYSYRLVARALLDHLGCAVFRMYRMHGIL